MAFYAQKAAQLESKGGLKNLLYVVANADDLPPELLGLINEVTVLFPWGSLLKAVASGDERFLTGLVNVMTTKASLSIVFSLEETIEKKVMNTLGLAALNKDTLDSLCLIYARSGLNMKWRYISQDELKKFPTTWGKRLAYGRARPVVEFWGNKF